MPIRFVFTLMMAAVWSALSASLIAAQTRSTTSPWVAPVGDSTLVLSDAFKARIGEVAATVRVRDSLTTLADSATGASRELLEELIWQRQEVINAGLLEVANLMRAEQAGGKDLTGERLVVSEGIRQSWPRYLTQLERRQRQLDQLSSARDAATGAARLAAESEMTRQSDRVVTAYETLVDLLRAFERVGIELPEQRAYLTRALHVAAEGLVTRVQLANRDRMSAGALLSRDASNTELRFALESNEEKLKRATHSLSTAIRLMDRIGLETTDFRVALISMTGRITADVFKWEVLIGLQRALWRQFLDFLAGKAPQWLFQGLIITLTFLGFRALSRFVRRAVRRAVQHSGFSELLRDTVTRLSAYGVMLVGFLVILTQLGVQVAPLLAGLGVAGFVVGFAMQNTLSNFAAGGMILGNQPFDVGDEIEVAGVVGTVKRMSLVSTTILTPDNQKLIIPNSNVWGGVIRNRTAQPTRRVDLTFGIGYGDDIDKAEHVLREIVVSHPNVLKEPAPTVKLNQLADSSVIFVVRAWTAQDRHQDVQWDLTRAVKLRFDHEGISIPFPQRELHVRMERGEAEAVLKPEAAKS